jgi:hypothetical protein
VCRLRNDGDLPLRVAKVTIDGRECEARGFRVEQCRWPLPHGDVAFDVLPGARRSITLRYVPDFSSADDSASLVFHSVGAGTTQFTLRALIPPELLAVSALRQRVAVQFTHAHINSHARQLYHCLLANNVLVV